MCTLFQMENVAAFDSAWVASERYGYLHSNSIFNICCYVYSDSSSVLSMALIAAASDIATIYGEKRQMVNNSIKVFRSDY